MTGAFCVEGLGMRDSKGFLSNVRGGEGLWEVFRL